MTYLIRLLVLMLLAVLIGSGLGDYEVTQMEVEPISISKPSSPLQLDMKVDSLGDSASNVAIQLGISATVPVYDIAINWESPESPSPLSELSQSFRVDAFQTAAISYSVPLVDGNNQILTVSATGHTDDGSIVGMRITRILSVVHGQYSLQEPPEQTPSQQVTIVPKTKAGDTSTAETDFTEQFSRVPKKPNVEQGQALVAPSVVTITVKGLWLYADKQDVEQNWSYARVEIWDDDSDLDELLGYTHTIRDGRFEIAVSSAEADGPDIYIKIFTRDDYSVWVGSSTTDINDTYWGVTPTVNNVTVGTYDIGTWVARGAYQEVVYIYDLLADDARNYLYNVVGWDSKFNVPVKWPSTSDEGTKYRLDDGIYLLPHDSYDHDVILHEYGHFVMDKTYSSLPSAPNCKNHEWPKRSSNGCAWVEGWATFFQAAVQNDKFYDDTDGDIFLLHINMEPPSQSPFGADVEGAVAGSLWDVFDSHKETWDNLNNGINGANHNGIWSIFFNNRDVNQFEQRWLLSANGFNNNIKAIFSHHGIAPKIALKNGSFELDANADSFPDGWSSNDIFKRNKDIPAIDGNFVGRFRATNNASATITQVVRFLDPGKLYNFSGMVRIPETSDKFTFKIQIVWRNSNNVPIQVTNVASYATPTQTWKEALISTVSPAGTTNAAIRMIVSNLNAKIYVDRFRFFAP